MAFDDNKLDLIDTFVFDEEVDSHEGQHNESDVLESLKLPEIPSRYFAESSHSSSFQSSTGFLIGQEEKENKIHMMDWPELYENENINFAAENLGLKFTDEIHHHHHRPVVESSVVIVNDDSMNLILKSRPNNVNNEDDQGSSNDIIHENRLKRYKPSSSSSSSKRKSHLTVKPEKKIRTYTSKCSLCKATPHCLDRNICHKCGSSPNFKCRSCNYSCKKYSTIITHYRVKHMFDFGDRDIHCLYCDKKFVYSSLHCHYKRFHAIEKQQEKNQKTLKFYELFRLADEEVYQCYKCNFRSYDRSDVKRHILDDEHDPIFQKLIDEPIKLPQQLQPTAVQEAKNTSADITPDFVSNDILDMLDLHCIDCNNMNSLDRVICDYCDWPNLQYHCRRCQQSPAMFASKIEGVVHVKKYHLLKNNVCDNCGNDFVRLKNLTDHKQYCLLVSDKK